MKPRKYDSPAAFKQALEDRLRSQAKGGMELSRRRQLLVFERYLARITQTFGERVLLKGGLVLELRLDRARTTKDIDLRVSGDSKALLELLRQAGRLDLGDFLTYEVQADQHHPEFQNEGMKYEGQRFRAEGKLAGKLYGQAFGIDVAFGDPIIGKPETLTAPDELAFARIPAPTIRAYPLETHIAEKLHAYTLPHERENTRVKDLPDIALLASIRELDFGTLREALATVFKYRATHNLPVNLPPPPASWTKVYLKMSKDNGLAWDTIESVTAAASAFIQPCLMEGPDMKWVPSKWSWNSK